MFWLTVRQGNRESVLEHERPVRAGASTRRPSTRISPSVTRISPSTALRKVVLRSRSADDRHQLALVHIEVDVVENASACCVRSL